MNRAILKRALAILLSSVFVACCAFSAFAEPETAADEQVQVLDTVLTAVSSAGDYPDYLAANSGFSKTGKTYPLTSADTSDTSKTVEKDGAVYSELSSENKSITYLANVDAAGIYNIKIEYLAIEGKMKNIVFSLFIDGELPFSEASSISLSRVFKDNGNIEKDTSGNEIRPSQVEVNRLNSAYLLNSDGYYNDPYEFALTAGEHSITLRFSEEDMLVSGITLVSPETLKSYEEYSKGAVDTKEVSVKVEAENSYEKSSSMLYPTYDRSSPATSPSHYSKIRYNTIGQSNWSQQGQWISWKISVPKDGWYNITLKARQNYQQGINSCRTLRIDGDIPFEEVKNINFPYSLNWYMNTLSDNEGTPYLFHLTEGEHTLSLEVAAGEMGLVLKGLSDSVLDLNAIYRSIIMVTGTTPDIYRTYYLEESIPDLEKNITSVRDELEQLYSRITEITGTGGSESSVILEMKTMLDYFLKKPLEIQNRVSAFKSNIESMGSVLLTLSTQPLELDYILVTSGDKKIPSADAGFFEFLGYSIKGFFASFIEDYNSISSSKNFSATTEIKVWISNGRDQAQILKNLIDNRFTPEKNISVALSVVSTAAGTSSSTLVQATLAGKGPDVAIFTPKDTPVNLAMRGALTDLSAMSGYEEVYSQFYASAWIPYKYNGGVYAVPETQNFDMLFYRTDIFEELGLSAPQTWDEFYSVVELLQKSNLEMGVLETNAANAGISSGISFFDKLLLQNGGRYYNDKLSKTEFTKDVAYEAFKSWTDLYSKYGLSRSFDFYNRFRSGEMPVGIMNYVTYNQLYSAAPEIRGLWKMAPVPGTLRQDGTIDRTETASGTASVILNDCKHKTEAWEFVRWWTGKDAQASYGTELEATLGVAARYDTANTAAFESIGWTKAEGEVLKEQWEQVTDIPQIPGNYFISRCLTNAFRTVVDEGENPVRALNIYNKDMNSEIARKRAEFDLD